MSVPARIPSWVAVLVLMLATAEATRGDDDPLRARVYADFRYRYSESLLKIESKLRGVREVAGQPHRGINRY